MEYDFIMSIGSNTDWTSIWSTFAAFLSALSAAISCYITYKFRTSFKYQHKFEFYMKILTILKFEKLEKLLTEEYYDILQMSVNAGCITPEELKLELKNFNEQINILEEHLRTSFHISKILFEKKILNINELILNIDELIKYFDEIKQINESICDTSNYPSDEQKKNLKKYLTEINKNKYCIIDKLEKLIE